MTTATEYPSWASLVGNRPTLEWVDVTKMDVDPSYQREASAKNSRKHIEKIALEFNWARFQPLILASRGDGTYAILDGQHKREAALLVGLDELPCMIVKVSGVEQEADSFVSVNKNRLSVSPFQIHWSQAAAGDKSALQINKVCAEAGVTISRYARIQTDLKPGVTMALVTIKKSIATYGEKHVVDALSIINEAFPGKGGQLRSGMIAGVCLLFASIGDQDMDWKRLCGIIGMHDTDDFEAAARSYREHFGGKPDKSIAMALVKLYNKKLGENRQIRLA